MSDWTAERIAEIRAVCDAATPGKLVISGDRILDDDADWVVAILGAKNQKANATFIAIARQALPSALDEIERLRKESELLRSVLENAKSVLSLANKLHAPDFEYESEIRALGERVGYGAMMTSASALWRQSLRGYAGGGEFVAGPCRGTVTALLREINMALTAERDVVLPMKMGE